MKNWEKYEKEIKELGLAHIAVTKNGKMKMCNKECDDCIFNENENTHCSDSFLDWLYEEYKEPLKVDWTVPHELTEN